MRSVHDEILQAVRVMAFFPGGTRGPGKIGTYEYLIFVRAAGAGAASERALAVLRSARDDPEALKKLGSRAEPSLCVVVWACYVELPDGTAVPLEHPMIINYMTLDEQDVKTFMACAEARFPVRLFYFED
jgi:hypothetical protein